MHFDDSRLDDSELLAATDQLFRPLATTGAQLRQAWATVEPLLDTASLSQIERPRAIVATGPEARLLRAVLEPACPVPFIAWTGSELPPWVGALDLVVVLDPIGRADSPIIATALRRGCQLLVVCPPESLTANQARSRYSLILPSDDPLNGAVLALAVLARIGIGPIFSVAAVADAFDEAAITCAAAKDLAVNPAKMLALAIADTRPLIWGGSVLAARAGRRIGEAIRAATGELALAADFHEVLPLLERSQPRDVFVDPVEIRCDPPLSLLVVGSEIEIQPETEMLAAAARQAGIRISQIMATDENDLVRYCSWLGTGRFAAAYLRLGLI